MKTQQLNVELTAAELLRIKKDALRLGVSLKDYAKEAFRSFQSTPIDDLRARFAGRNKIYGRKVAL